MHPWIIIACIYSTHSVFSDVIDYTDIYFKFCKVADGGLFCSMLRYYEASPLCFHSLVFWVLSISFCTVTLCVLRVCLQPQLKMLTVLAGQHEQVYENMSHFTPDLKGKNKNVYFGTRKTKPVFGIVTKNCSVNPEGQLVMVNHVTCCFIRTITLAFTVCF